jgi:hypothetical protein
MKKSNIYIYIYIEKEWKQMKQTKENIVKHIFLKQKEN